jgi:hypothetical protein
VYARLALLVLLCTVNPAKFYPEVAFRPAKTLMRCLPPNPDC